MFDDDEHYLNWNLNVLSEIWDPDKSKPYLSARKTVEFTHYHYNPEYGDDRMCRCGHPYYRHFDTYEDMRPVGCKYCACMEYVENVAMQLG